jgi:uncharacterized protein YidB (DUF937 family)
MGILDSLTNFAKEASAGGDHAAVASGLLEQLGGPGGVSGLIQSFHQNGAGGLIQQFANGQTQATDPAAIQQALQGTGLIEGIAQRTGISPDTVRSSLATIVPVLINHVTANGHVTTDGQPAQTPMPDGGSLVQSILGKLLG